jgi:hypothetical protein
VLFDLVLKLGITSEKPFRPHIHQFGNAEQKICIDALFARFKSGKLASINTQQPAKFASANPPRGALDTDAASDPCIDKGYALSTIKI